MEREQNEVMKRDLDRFAQNLSKHDARKQNGLRTLAAEKAEIDNLCELLLELYTRDLLHALHQ